MRFVAIAPRASPHRAPKAGATSHTLETLGAIVINFEVKMKTFVKHYVLLLLILLGGCMLFKSEQDARKSKSIKILKKYEIPYIEHLPVIEAEKTITLRTKEEICDRAICLALVAAYAEGLEKSILEKKIIEFKVKDKFSPDEMKLFETQNLDHATKAKFTWRYESLWVLLWSLGYVEKMDMPTEICDVKFSVETIVNRGRDKFIQEAKLRSKKEILDQADLIFRIHWATTEARLKNTPMPGKLDNGIVYERHYSLNWLIKYMDEEWDDISTDT